MVVAMVEEADKETVAVVENGDQQKIIEELEIEIETEIEIEKDKSTEEMWHHG